MKVCVHAPCSCRVDGDAIYCSEACEVASAEKVMDDCPCPHKRCRTS